MALSAKEKKLLDQLVEKEKQPAPPSVGKSLSVSVDLGDEKQVALARKYGFLPDDEEPDETEEEETEEEGDDTPQRRGYFGGKDA